MNQQSFAALLFAMLAGLHAEPQCAPESSARTEQQTACTEPAVPCQDTQILQE